MPLYSMKTTYKTPSFLTPLTPMVGFLAVGAGCVGTTPAMNDPSAAAAIRVDKPNVIIIFTDDQGYADLGCFGSETIRTPHIDRMAKEGMKFSSFMVGSSVCTPSRAALLTGCYPKTVGMHKGVLHPDATIGLHPDTPCNVRPAGDELQRPLRQEV